jgi:hypothetical protein
MQHDMSVRAWPCTVVVTLLVLAIPATLVAQPVVGVMGIAEEIAPGATAIEMEGAALVQACRQFGTSCLVVRSVTDRADGQAMSNYREYIVAATENAAAVVAAIITKPASEKGR